MTEPHSTFKLGTRGSRLALLQARAVERMLRSANPGLDVEIVVVKTSGDVQADLPLSRAGGRGFFTRELDLALLDGRVDAAVHSLKDVPTELPEGIVLAAVPERKDPGEAFLSRAYAALKDLPEGARVGTGSPRRRAQLLALRPDLHVEEIRGNVETRIAKLDAGAVDGLVLARAGLRRLGLADRITELLPPGAFLPAPGQGALGITVRKDDGNAAEAARRIDRPEAARAVEAERAFLAALGGGCRTPAACFGRVRERVLRVRGLVAAPEGAPSFRGEVEGRPDEAAVLGRALAKRLLQEGAEAVLEAEE